MIHPAIWDIRILVDEESDISPTLAVFLKGCNLGCLFCMAYDHSRVATWPLGISCKSDCERVQPDAQGRVGVSSLGIAETFCALILNADRVGARTVSFIGGEPLLYMEEIRKAWEMARQIGTVIPPIVLNSNLLIKSEDIVANSEFISLYLADIKFGNDRCAADLTSGVISPLAETALLKNYKIARNLERGINTGIGYFPIITTAIKAAASLPGKRLVIRHLLLPGHIHCCTVPILSWLTQEVPNVPIHLLTNYYPNGKSGILGIERTLSEYEKEEVFAKAYEYRLNLVTSSLSTGTRSFVAAKNQQFELLCRSGRTTSIIISNSGDVLMPDLPSEMTFLVKRLSSY